MYCVLLDSLGEEQREVVVDDGGDNSMLTPARRQVHGGGDHPQAARSLPETSRGASPSGHAIIYFSSTGSCEYTIEINTLCTYPKRQWAAVST